MPGDTTFIAHHGNKYLYILKEQGKYKLLLHMQKIYDNLGILTYRKGVHYNVKSYFIYDRFKMRDIR